jgi:cell division protein FtsB
MRLFKRSTVPRRGAPRLWAGLVAVLMLAAVTALVGNAAWGMYGKFTEAATADAQAQAQLSSLEQQQAQMTAAVRNLSTPVGVESQLRQRYGVVKPGEGVIDIIEPATTTPAPAQQTGDFFVRLWDAVAAW